MHTLFGSEDLVLEYPIIYGISSHLRHVKLGYELSQHPDFLVEFYKDVVTYNKKSVHSAYLLTYLDDSFQCLVVRNKGTNSLFYKKYKNVDYLVCSLSDEETNKDIINKIGNLGRISICFALDNPEQKEILNFTQLL